VHSQNEKPERDSYTLKLPVDSINFYELEVKSGPYFVADKVLQMYATETIFIEVETKKKEIVSMKTVKENVNPEKTITVALTQTVKDKKSEMMMLKIANPFKYELQYKAQMNIVRHNKWIPTNVYPVKPKLTTFEIWGDVIISLVLSDWLLK
jgi:sulfate adenylyltransferase subunit 1 (EFTu-like GTPase family)